MTTTKTAARMLEEGLAHHKAGREDLADQLYEQALRRDRKNATGWYLRSVVAMSARRVDRAVELLEKAVELAPENAVFLCNLGDSYRRLERHAEAVAILRRAVTLKPDLAEAHHNLGLAYQELGDLGAAIASFESALRLRPDLVAAESWLIRVLSDAGLWEDAIARFRKASPSTPESAQLHEAMANALANTFRAGWYSGRASTEVELRLDEAISHFERAIELDPNRASAHDGLARALHDRGDLDLAIGHLRKTLELVPNQPVAHSNLVFLLAFDPSCDALRIRDEARRWERQQASHITAARAHPNDRDPNRRLRIGYLSPNFRRHCQSLFVLPLLRHHNHEAFEVFAYSLGKAADDSTDRMKECCDVWRDVSNVDNEGAARLIRDDEVDILVDLTMHMGENRALLLARKPAPVQICWLAYPGTTGLSAIDYRITDVFLDPPESDDSIYTEQPLRLPDSFWVYDPMTRLPEVSSLPALEKGHITFGSLNTFRKMNAATLDLWAPLLRAVPGARLVLLAPPGEARVRLCEALAARGVDPRRVDLVGHQPRDSYLASYQRIDIGLDPLPAHGHTTSLDAFWMGVPVVTMIGSTVLGRAGLCLAANLGLRDLVATTPEEFVEIGVRYAKDPAKLAELRRGLRARMDSSPLMDAPRFARNLEVAYRKAWQAWCATISSD